MQEASQSTSQSTSQASGARLPGGDLVVRGREDLAARVESIEALLVSRAATRLRNVGHSLPAPPIPAREGRLHRLLDQEHGDGARSQHNASRRRLVSFLRADRCARR